MAIVITVTTISPEGSLGSSGGLVYAFGTLAFSGSYAVGGDGPLAFAGLGPQGMQIPSSQAPLFVSIWGVNGYSYGWVPSSGKVKINTTANAELTAGAYPAGVTGDTVYFEAGFLLFG